MHLNVDIKIIVKCNKITQSENENPHIFKAYHSLLVQIKN